MLGISIYWKASSIFIFVFRDMSIRLDWSRPYFKVTLLIGTTKIRNQIKIRFSILPTILHQHWACYRSFSKWPAITIKKPWGSLKSDVLVRYGLQNTLYKFTVQLGPQTFQNQNGKVVQTDMTVCRIAFLPKLRLYTSIFMYVFFVCVSVADPMHLPLFRHPHPNQRIRLQGNSTNWTHISFVFYVYFM